ncbi:MAG: putative Ig domain-containing protein [Defluviitaleaceae bacterium]|nr:putative Ig domain-containing protein [Defluviitaleaceae bacterium]MCL2263074.1 putative Ig domain-containing protein [Defluviitaleaceae bacterium]
MYKSFKKIVCLLMAIVMTMGVMPVTAEHYTEPNAPDYFIVEAFGGDIDITDDFTCSNFLQVVRTVTGIAAPERIFLQDVNTVDNIDAPMNGITSLAGLQHFTALEALSVWGNFITEIDLRYNPNLISLIAFGNQLTHLNVSHSPLLESLVAHENNLTALDVSQNPLLTAIGVGGNRLTSLDISNNPALVIIDVHYNYLASPDYVIGWQDLFAEPGDEFGAPFWFFPQRDRDITDDFTCANFLAAVRGITGIASPASIFLQDVNTVQNVDVHLSEITSLDGLQHFAALENLNAWGNYLTEINVASNAALRFLAVGQNQLTTLDVSHNTALTRLHAEDNKLTELDVYHNFLLNDLFVCGNSLTELDLSNLFSLSRLGASDNYLTELNLYDNLLSELTIRGNLLTQLDISYQEWLMWLDVQDNKLTELDVSNSPFLDFVFAGRNQLTALDVSNNPDLRVLTVEHNQLTGLDVSYNPRLEFLGANGNLMSEPDCVTGWEKWFDKAWCFYEFAWQEINPEGFIFFPQGTAPPLDITDDFTCENFLAAVRGITGIDYPSRIYLHDVNTVQTLPIASRGITSLDGLQHFAALKGIRAGGNYLTEINVTSNAALEHMCVWDNQLTEIDVSHNPLLEILDVRFNQLTQLDVSQNPLLDLLFADNNQLTALDVSANPMLILLDVHHNFMLTPDCVIGWENWFDYAGDIYSVEFRFFPQIRRAPLITTTDLPDGTVGTAYSFQFEAKNAEEWAVIGALPLGLNFTTCGALFGMPVESGVFEFTVRAYNSYGYDTLTVIVYIAPQDIPYDATVLRVSSESAHAGGEVTVHINIENNPGFAAMLMRVAFPEAFTLVGYSVADFYLYEGFRISQKMPAVGNNVFLGWAGLSEEITMDGTLLSLTFAVHESANINNPIIVTFENAYNGYESPSNLEKEELDIVIVHGNVQLQPSIAGDFDGDGRVTSADATLLARYLVGQNVTIDRRAANEPLSVELLTHLARALVGHMPLWTV